MKCLGPMVDGSELPYRLLLNNVTHTWTPMYNVNIINNGNKKLVDEIVKSIQFEKEHTDHQVILQLACNNSESLRQAYQLLSPNAADYIEINMGCAQQIAKSGGYGCYLLDNIQNSVHLVKTLSAIAPDKKISVKTRLFDKLHDFLRKVLQEVNVSLVTIHGRLKGLKMGCYSGPSDFEAVLEAARVVKQASPQCDFVLNGGLYNEFQARFMYLKHRDIIDGTMAATFLLRNVFLYGISTKRYSGVKTLHYVTSQQEALETVGRVRHACSEFIPFFERELAEIQAKNNLKFHKNVKYTYNIVALGLDVASASMSGDQEVAVMKATTVGPGEVPLFYSFELKLNNLLSLLSLIDNYEMCQEQRLEAPWRGLCLHFHAQAGRDILNANVDVRGLTNVQFSRERLAEILKLEEPATLTNQQIQEKTQIVKINFMKLAVCTLVERLYNGHSCA